MLSTRRKNSEKRKEKSRFAARARRSRESEIFNEMGSLLPLHQTIDKASTMRLAISFIRTRNLIDKCSLENKSEDKILSPDELNKLGAIDTLLADTFFLVLTQDGHMPYISENVEKYLGLKQVDLLGLTVFEFSHPCDHSDIRDILAHKFGSKTISFLIRFKCTITSKGKTINLKSAAYKVIKLTGHWVGDESCGYLCLIGEPLACPSKIDEPMAEYVFLSRHSPDMKFTDIDERFTKILGYKESDLIGKSVYNLFHALDCINLSEYFKTLFTKGQSETGYYRLLAKRGGYIWIQTQATLITDNHTQQPISVVCVNYALSGIENQEEIISEEQCQERQKESYHLVDETNDVFIKLAASSLIDTSNNPTDTNINNTKLSQIETTHSTYDNQGYIDYQLSSGILVNKPVSTENLLNNLVNDQSSTCSQVKDNQLEEEQSQYQQQHCQQQQQQTCNQGQLQSILIQPSQAPAFNSAQSFTRSSTPFIFTPLAGNSLPTPATATIFAPRTADMNPGFLMPIGDDDNNFGLTVLPDIEACDPEQDLTHLAPQAGDYCVPLEIGPLPSFDGFSMENILKEMGFASAVAENSCDPQDEIVMSGKSDTDSTPTINPNIINASSTDTHLSSKPNDSCKINATVTSDSASDAVIIKNKVNTVDNCDVDENDDEETLNFTDYLPTDNKLLPFIPTAVAEEEIQFSCDEDVGLTSETRNSKSCVIDEDGLGDTNSLSDFLCNQRLIETPILDHLQCTTLKVDERTISNKTEIVQELSKSDASKSDSNVYNKCDFTPEEDIDNYVDAEDDNVSSICSPDSDVTVGSGGSGVGCNSSTNNLLLEMNLNKHGINGSSSPLHNDPFLSFTNGLGGLVSDNYLCSLSSSSSSSSSPSNFYISSRNTTNSPDFTLTSVSINRNPSESVSKRPSSLCDSPPPSSCNSTLTSDLDLCGSFAAEDEDEFDSLGGRSCGRIDRTIERHCDDEFPLLPNDESIWDMFIHSNDINDMINSDELLSASPTYFDDHRFISKENTLKGSSTSCSSDSTSTNNGSNNFANEGADGSSESNSNGNNDSFLLNSNLAMLLQGKDTPFKNYSLASKQSVNQASSHHQQQQSSVSLAVASRNRFHNYSANLPKTSSSSSPSSSSSVDSNRINSNYVIVQNNRSIKTSSNHANGTKDIIKSAQTNLQNCDMSRNEIDHKSDYFTLDSEMKKYQTMADSVYSKFGPNYVKIARKLAYNSSSSSSSVPPPKRAYLPSKSSLENNYKRMKLPSTLPSMQGTSVLMNLLVNGEDVTNGYSRFQQQSHLKNNSLNVNIG